MDTQQFMAWMAEEHPEKRLRELHASGELRAFLPEVDALWGVPQPELHHPEVDTGEHVALVLEQAARLSPEPVVRYAALMHDLGKALTPAEDLPRHPGHEERGVRPARKLGQRLALPEDWVWLGEKTSEYHLHAHRALEMSPKGVVRFFETSGFLEQPRLFEMFVLACEADARGRKGLQERDYPQADFLRRMHDVLSAAPGEPSNEAHNVRIRWAKIECKGSKANA